jgi:Xaa-Pro dipeptidase
MSIQPDLSFGKKEYQARLARVRTRMEARGVDVLLVHDFPNICYLSGYQSWNTADYYALIVPGKGEPILVLWASELSNAKLTSWLSQTRTFPTRGDPVLTTINALKDLDLTKRRMGVELTTPFLSVETHRRLRDAFPETTFVNCSGLIQEVRVIKSPTEIAYIREAARITEAGMRSSVAAARVGGTDQEIAAAAYHTMVTSGSQYMCIPPVVSAGSLAGVPHSTHRGVVLESGNTVLLEMSGCVHRYNAPLMRSLVLGAPDDTVRRMADAIYATLNLVIENMVPGRVFDEIAAIGEGEISKAGPEMIFHHTFAYSVGLGFPPTWADCPVRIVEGDFTTLKPGMVFHLPISLRDEGRHGVSMSETVVITEAGAEVVTDLDRRLFER